MEQFEARCIAVKDGDTFVAVYRRVVTIPEWRLTIETWPPASVRLLGVDCPERNTPAGPPATAATVAWFAEHDHTPGEMSLTLETDGDDNFGRPLALVWCRRHPEISLSQHLILTGHGVVYRGGPHGVQLERMAAQYGSYHASRMLHYPPAPQKES